MFVQCSIYHIHYKFLTQFRHFRLSYSLQQKKDDFLINQAIYDAVRNIN